jgi:DNA invertase Pin-like site-specific DNA recombinase
VKTERSPRLLHHPNDATHTALPQVRQIRWKFPQNYRDPDWKDPFGRLFLQTLAMVAEFEANIGHLRTREGMAKARRQGKLRGKQPKLPPSAARTIRRRYVEDEVSLADLAEEYSVGRSTIHRIIHRPEPDSTAQQA